MRNQKKQINIFKAEWPFVLFLLGLIYCTTFFLFYKQATYDGTGFMSDFHVHIYDAIEGHGYSINAVILKIGYLLGGNMGCAGVLSLFVVITAFLAAKLFLKILSLSDSNIHLTFPQALLAVIPILFIGSIYIPHIYPLFYIDPEYSGIGLRRSSLVTQPWHNSTYLVMKCFGLFAIEQYLDIEVNYLEKGITLRQWIKFFISLALVNAAKPSFIIAFAPAMLFVMIYKFVKRRGDGFRKMVYFGLAVICSLPIVLFQFNVLFPGDISGNEASGIEVTISALKGIVKGQYLFRFVMTGLLFSFVVTFLCIWKKEKSFILGFSWMMFLISFAESIFLQETGYRAAHGNFGWGRFFFAFVLIMVCFERLITLFSRKKIGISWFLFSSFVFIWMIGSGIVFFIKLLEGSSYLI